MYSKFINLLLIPYLASCGHSNNEVTSQIATINFEKKEDAGSKVSSRFPVPPGYERQEYDKNTFQYYLSHFPLKPVDSRVYYYNGQPKSNRVHAAVLDIDVGNKDLQQCADAIMRLRAEYLYEQKRYGDIHFNFTNDARVDYIKWAKGYRLKISGNTITWYKATVENYSYNTLREYLESIFAYAGTLSLAKELTSKTVDRISVGDVFIKGGSPGHAVIVVDVAINKKNGNRIFMIAQSYMPAQNIHILINKHDDKLSPWYDLSQTDKLYSPEWTFEKTQLKKF